MRASGRAGVFLWLAVTALGLPGCRGSRASEPVRSFVEEPFPERLSAWNLFRGNGSTLEPNTGVVPYELNSALFTDYAEKFRTLWLPPGQAATYRDAETFDFPVGTIPLQDVPERSILLYRLESKDPGVMMPELGRTLVHEEGVALVREWISQLEGTCEGLER